MRRPVGIGRTARSGGQGLYLPPAAKGNDSLWNPHMDCRRKGARPSFTNTMGAAFRFRARTHPGMIARALVRENGKRPPIFRQGKAAAFASAIQYGDSQGNHSLEPPEANPIPGLQIGPCGQCPQASASAHPGGNRRRVEPCGKKEHPRPCGAGGAGYG